MTPGKCQQRAFRGNLTAAHNFRVAQYVQESTREPGLIERFTFHFAFGLKFVINTASLARIYRTKASCLPS